MSATGTRSKTHIRSIEAPQICWMPNIPYKKTSEWVKATGTKSPYQVNRSARKPSSASVTHMNCYYNEESRKQNAKYKCNRENRKQEAKNDINFISLGKWQQTYCRTTFMMLSKLDETKPQDPILNGFLWNMCESFLTWKILALKTGTPSSSMMGLILAIAASCDQGSFLTDQQKWRRSSCPIIKKCKL